MFPISLDLSHTKIALVGNGPATARRLAQLDDDKAQHVRVFSDNPSEALIKQAGDRLVKALPTHDDLATAQIVMIVDLKPEVAEPLATQARNLSTLVNIEDNRPYCDFHFTSHFKRGDLLLTVSTNGKSPALGKRLTRILKESIGPEWEPRLDEIAKQREHWKAQDLSLKELEKNTNRLIDEKGWLTHLESKKDEAA